jgi:hypothetical protein
MAPERSEIQLGSKQRVKKQKSFSFIDRNNVYFMQNAERSAQN